LTRVELTIYLVNSETEEDVAAKAARTRDADLTREALISAATRLFARHGFDGVTVEAIAREAGVNKAMINYYFRGKAGLYEAILTATFAEIAGRVEAVRRSSRSADEALAELMGAIADVATVRRSSFPALFLREAIEGGPRARVIVVPYLRTVLSAVAELLARGVQEGRFRPVDPLLTHLTIVGALVFFFATTPLRERIVAETRLPFAVPTPETFVAHLQELIARGLAATAGRTAAKPTRPRQGRS
jgi:TetR/AcrR family transcriptional regulator